MERNELATIGRLCIGDRFYKATDKDKEVWELQFYEKSKWTCSRDSDKFPTFFKADTEVVFLRSRYKKEN